MERFSNAGIKGVTMDDLARITGMSKKTVYQYFDNKSNLILEEIQLVVSQLKGHIHENAVRSKNALHELTLQRNVIGKLINVRHVINRRSLRDYPDALMEVNDFKLTFLPDLLLLNLQKGITQHLYRRDLNIDLASRAYLMLIESLICQQFSDIELIIYSIDLFIHCIANRYGRDIYQQFSIMGYMDDPESNTQENKDI